MSATSCCGSWWISDFTSTSAVVCLTTQSLFYFAAHRHADSDPDTALHLRAATHTDSQLSAITATAISLAAARKSWAVNRLVVSIRFAHAPKLVRFSHLLLQNKHDTMSYKCRSSLILTQDYSNHRIIYRPTPRKSFIRRLTSYTVFVLYCFKMHLIYFRLFSVLCSLSDNFNTFIFGARKLFFTVVILCISKWLTLTATSRCV